MLPVTRHVSTAAETVWDVLTDLDRWPEWGLSILGARLDNGGRQLQSDSRGHVQTVLGVWLPFNVTQWQTGRSWRWAVARVPATAHRVTPTAQGCAATIEVPLWAIPYAAACWVSLGRVGEVAGRIEHGSAH